MTSTLVVSTFLALFASACDDERPGPSEESPSATPASGATAADPEIACEADSTEVAAALAVLGLPCTTEQERACTAHTSSTSLLCLNGQWRSGGAACPAQTYCDTRPGPRQGTCQPVLSECAGKAPGEAVCLGSARGRCDLDLLRTVPDPCPARSHCDATDVVRCVCDEGTTEDGIGRCIRPTVSTPHSCAAGYTEDGRGGCERVPSTCESGYALTEAGECADVDECKYGNGGCDWRTRCRNNLGGRTCGQCPAGYHGDGETGCVHIEWSHIRDDATAQRAKVALGVVTDAAGNVYVVGNTAERGQYDMFLAKYDGTGAEIWERRIGTDARDTALAIAIDRLGHVFVAGWTEGALDCVANLGGADGFVVKFDWNGEKHWSRQFGSAAADYIAGAATDASGNVYLVGYSEGNLGGDGNEGVLGTLVVKYDRDGEQQWVRQTNSGEPIGALAAATDPAGNVYLVGQLYGALDGATNSGGKDAYIMKYDGAGQRQWARQFGSAGWDTANRVTADVDGYVYVSGETYGTIGSGPVYDFQPRYAHVYVAKYSAAGEPGWVHPITVGYQDSAGGVAVDALGDVYVTGMVYRADTPTDTGGNGPPPPDIFVSKLARDGTRRWFYEFDVNVREYANAVALDKRGNIYLAGSTRVHFGSTASSALLLVKLR